MDPSEGRVGDPLPPRLAPHCHPVSKPGWASPIPSTVLLLPLALSYGLPRSMGTDVRCFRTLRFQAFLSIGRSSPDRKGNHGDLKPDPLRTWKNQTRKTHEKERHERHGATARAIVRTGRECGRVDVQPFERKAGGRTANVRNADGREHGREIRPQRGPRQTSPW